MSRISDKFKELTKLFDETMFPGFSCDVCGIELEDNEIRLCESCMNSLKFHNGKVCVKCGAPIEPKELICQTCKDVSYAFDRAYSVCDYNQTSASMVKIFKFDLKKHVGETIGNLMAEYFFKRGIKADYLTFVPLGQERFKERGFNQSQVLAEVISKKTKIPVVDLLYRAQETPKQSLLTQKERLKNLSGAFKIKTNFSLKDKIIILIDDVFTTGTTLDECSKVLAKLRPKEIIAFTFAKTDFQAKGNNFDEF